MRLRNALLATILVAGFAGSALAQGRGQSRSDRRDRVWTELRNHPRFRIPDAGYYRFHLAPDRSRMAERARETAERARRLAVERAGEVRARVQERTRDALERRREREQEMRERMTERMRQNLERGRALRERDLDRMRDRLNRVWEERGLMLRRRLRNI